MPITVITGRPSAGKSLRLAATMVEILERNITWYKLSGVRRLVVSNLKLTPKYEHKYEGFFRYWTEPSELVHLRDVDVFWDEIATHLDSSQFANLPLEIKRWLQQHAKVGVEIFGTTQDFAMIDVSMRRMTSDLYYLVKLLGSRRPSNTRPPVRTVWGVIAVYELDAVGYKEGVTVMGSGWFTPMFITKKNTEVFDTLQKIEPGEMPPLRHEARRCLTCGEEKVTHR